MNTWVHLHLPRLRSGARDMISVKTPGEHIGYYNVVSMRSCTFKVHESGRQRCIREGVRNVHAWVVGEVTARGSADLDSLPFIESTVKNMRRAVYDPFKGGSFVDSETLEPVHEADHVICIGKTVFYRQEVWS